MPSAKAPAKPFDAVLQRTGDRLNWVVIRVPFDAAKLWGRRGQIKVKGEIWYTAARGADATARETRLA